MEKSQTQENTITTMINKKRNNATTSSSLPTPNSSPSATKPNSEDDEPKSKIQRECYIMSSPNYNLKITFAKPSLSQQPSLNNNSKQPEASKVELKPSVHVISNNNKPNKKMRVKKPNNKSGNKLCFVDHNNDVTKASIVEHVRRNLGYNKEEISEVKIIMEKKMTPSDMSPEQARLALTAEKLDASFLRSEEKELLKKADINVKVIMGSFVYEMPLARWNNFVDKEKKKNNNNDNNEDDPGFKYVFKSGKGRQWPKLKKENGLQEDDYILVATFRYNNDLHFVIVKAKPVMVFGTSLGHTYSFED